MSQTTFYNFIFIIPISISFYIIFKSYFIIFVSSENTKFYHKDFLKGSKKRSLKLINGYFSTIIFNTMLIYTFYLYIFKSFENLLLTQHIFLSNSTYSILVNLFILSLIIQLFLENIINFKYKSLGGDYLLSICGILLYSPIMLLSNTIITLFFFLEVAVSLTLYNFITTWSVIKIKLKGSNKNSIESRSRSFFNLIFFQF